ncbi:MAG: flagellar filament capping protein FliD [Deltaproteobacteria bacterium]|nr:flagellar filament capping protein FliD [Deltaproteobacteria bacterium]
MSVIKFSGLASGIDSVSLIDAIIEAREAANVHRREEIELLESTNDSLEELNTKILALNELIDRFRTANGGGIEKKATSSDSTAVTAIAGSNAVNASYDISVTSVADTASGSMYKSAGSYASTSAVFSATTGVLSVDVGLGADKVSVTASVTGASTTIQEVVDALNADSDASGRVVASLVNTGTEASPAYQIMLNTLETGTQLGYLDIDPTSVFAADVSKTASQATNAQFTLSGLNGTITRESNIISDVVTGVTFNLIKADSASITISNDEDSSAELVGEIVDSFNDIVEFINENDTVTRVEDENQTDNIYGSLAKTSVDNDLVSFFRERLVAAESTNGTVVTSMSELGISTNRDGSLSFDADEFKSQVAQDALGASEVLTDFADNVAGVDGILYEFTKYNGFIDLAVQSNASQIENLNSAISQLERTTAKLRENLEGQFSRLETVMGKLQNTQQALSGILGGL